MAARTIGKRLLDRLGRRRAGPRAIEKTDAEWRAQLADEPYRVLRRKATERPFTGSYVHPGRDGVYRCAGCDSPLFGADAQFDSGTGWPSFTAVVPESVELRRDFSAGIPRTEALCRSCGGHLGHLFRDGPGPDRSRYCINACALTHEDADASAPDPGPLP